MNDGKEEIIVTPYQAIFGDSVSATYARDMNALCAMDKDLKRDKKAIYNLYSRLSEEKRFLLEYMSSPGNSCNGPSIEVKTRIAEIDRIFYHLFKGHTAKEIVNTFCCMEE